MGLMIDVVPNHMGVHGGRQRAGGSTCWSTVRHRATRTASTSTGTRSRTSCATRSCCRSWATSTAPCSSAARSSCASMRDAGAFSLWYYEHRLPVRPAHLPRPPRDRRAGGRRGRGPARVAARRLRAPCRHALRPAATQRRSTTIQARPLKRRLAPALHALAGRAERHRSRDAAAQRHAGRCQRASMRCTS